MNLIIALTTFALMEGVTWLTHKYVMHGFLWYLHEDHHNKREGAALEKNDSFFIIFAIPSMLLMAAGTYLAGYDPALYVGIGILLYGLAYFFVHDIFIHQRFKLFTRSNNAYLRAIRKAHKVHHKHLDKQEGECFGMLLVPFKYFRAELKNRKN